MSDQTNAGYFAARALEARKRSRSANDPRAAAAHAEMAARYEELAAEFYARSMTMELRRVG